MAKSQPWFYQHHLHHPLVTQRRKLNYSGIESKISSAGNSKLEKYIAKLLDEISIVDYTNENLEMKNINLLAEISWGDIQMKIEVCC